MRTARPDLPRCAKLLVGGALLWVATTGGLAADPPTTSAAPAESARIFGRIVDAQGKPVVGAEIRLYSIDNEQNWSTARSAIVTDAQGQYRLDGLPEMYFMLSAKKPGLARAFHPGSVEANQNAEVNLTMDVPARTTIRILDPEGKPLAAARAREFQIRGVNGTCYLPNAWMKAFGDTFAASGRSGLLPLLELPAGDILSVTIDHPDFAPIKISDVVAGQAEEVTSRMAPGVTVSLHLAPDASGARPTAARIDLRHEPFSHPSTVIHTDVPFDDQGIGRLTIAPGDYSLLSLTTKEFHISPQYSRDTPAQSFLRIEPGKNDILHLVARRKVTVRGRVLDAKSGAPVVGAYIMGEIPNVAPVDFPGPQAADWMFAGWGISDSQGEFAIRMVAGKARLSFQGAGRGGGSYVADADYVPLEVAPDGSTIAPDVTLRPLGKIVGKVQHADGTPAPRTVVRFRGPHLRHVQPVVTDAEGKFALQPPWVPTDDTTGGRVLTHPVVAFDPHRPLATRTAVRIDQPLEELVLTLEPQPADWLLRDFQEELSERERQPPAGERARELAEISLGGKAPPELEGTAWINTSGNELRLRELRGKYVLLDFWFKTCGPCHGDLPSVKLAHELFGSRGLVVIGVHNNSETAQTVRDHVAKENIPFPVIVDHPDGRTVARYEPHGVPDGYPCYVLIGPDGTVLLDDRTMARPRLRTYKLEIIRQYLLEHPLPSDESTP
ncbi:MAG: carboxypeptidase regulatory-like domain-containing protein [Planctomycetales bacterium]